MDLDMKSSGPRKRADAERPIFAQPFRDFVGRRASLSDDPSPSRRTELSTGTPILSRTAPSLAERIVPRLHAATTSLTEAVPATRSRRLVSRRLHWRSMPSMRAGRFCTSVCTCQRSSLSRPERTIENTSFAPDRRTPTSGAHPCRLVMKQPLFLRAFGDSTGSLSARLYRPAADQHHRRT